uniref:Uncharacterized protein n=1 Tax=Eutreptiella gymnastica TaxID=73025 RepID=A0A7S4CV22_9EUGL
MDIDKDAMQIGIHAAALQAPTGGPGSSVNSESAAAPAPTPPQFLPPGSALGMVGPTDQVATSTWTPGSELPQGAAQTGEPSAGLMGSASDMRPAMAGNSLLMNTLLGILDPIFGQSPLVMDSTWVPPQEGPSQDAAFPPDYMVLTGDPSALMPFPMDGSEQIPEGAQLADGLPVQEPEAAQPVGVGEPPATDDSAASSSSTFTGVWQNDKVFCFISSTATKSTLYEGAPPTDTFFLAIPQQPCEFLPVLGSGCRDSVKWFEVGVTRQVYKGGLTLTHTDDGAIECTDGWSRPCLLLDQVLDRFPDTEQSAAASRIASLFRVALHICEQDPSTILTRKRQYPQPARAGPLLAPASMQLRAGPAAHLASMHLRRPGAGNHTKRLPPPKIIPRTMIQFICGKCGNDYAHSVLHKETGKKIARWCPVLKPSDTHVPSCCPRCTVILEWKPGPSSNKAPNASIPAGATSNETGKVDLKRSLADSEDPEAKRQKTQEGGTEAPSEANAKAAAETDDSSAAVSSTSAAAGSGGRVSPEPNGEFAAAPLSDMMAAVSEKVYEREAEENPPHECPARLVRSSDTGCPEHSVCSGLWAAEGADGQYYPVLMSTVGCEVYWLVGSCPCKQAHICRFMQCSNSLLLIACATLYSTAEVWCRELPRVTLMNNCDHNTMPGSRWDVHVRGKKLTLQESIVGDGPPESACLQQFRSVVHFSELQDPKLMPKILESLGPCA